MSKIDGRFCYEQAPWIGWAGLCYGLDRRLVDARAVVDFAKLNLSEKSVPEEYDLAICDPSDELEVYHALASLRRDQPDDTIFIKKAWIFLLLKDLYERRNGVLNLFSCVEEIYADFDYPDFMNPIIHYMPVQDGELTGEVEILRKWEDLLSRLQNELTSGGSKVCL